MLLRMVAHSQYCWSGDNTVESVEDAIERAKKDSEHEHYVFLFSDANLVRDGSMR